MGGIWPADTRLYRTARGVRQQQDVRALGSIRIVTHIDVLCDLANVGEVGQVQRGHLLLVRR